MAIQYSGPYLIGSQPLQTLLTLTNGVIAQAGQAAGTAAHYHRCPVWLVTHCVWHSGRLPVLVRGYASTAIRAPPRRLCCRRALQPLSQPGHRAADKGNFPPCRCSEVIPPTRSRCCRRLSLPAPAAAPPPFSEALPCRECIARWGCRLRQRRRLPACLQCSAAVPAKAEALGIERFSSAQAAAAGGMRSGPARASRSPTRCPRTPGVPCTLLHRPQLEMPVLDGTQHVCPGVACCCRWLRCSLATSCHSDPTAAASGGCGVLHTAQPAGSCQQLPLLDGAEGRHARGGCCCCCCCCCYGGGWCCWRVCAAGGARLWLAGCPGGRRRWGRWRRGLPRHWCAAWWHGRWGRRGRRRRCGSCCWAGWQRRRRWWGCTLTVLALLRGLLRWHRGWLLPLSRLEPHGLRRRRCCCSHRSHWRRHTGMKALLLLLLLLCLLLCLLQLLCLLLLWCWLGLAS